MAKVSPERRKPFRLAFPDRFRSPEPSCGTSKWYDELVRSGSKDRSMGRTAGEGRRIWTYADLETLPDDGKRYEILEGDLIVMPSPSLRHQRTIRHLCVRLHRFLEERSTGEVILSPFDVVFDDTNVCQPDLLVVLTDHDAILTQRCARGAPDIAIEVLSPSTAGNDLVRKRRIYERHGVSEYWVIDPEERTARIYRRKAGRLVQSEELGPAGCLSSPILPGFDFPLAELPAG
jgi:Uma2 family endonuclease